MWRNISWNSTDSCLPDGMHKHETGAYFKTPSIQSAGSSQSGGTGANFKKQDSLESTGAGVPGSGPTAARMRPTTPPVVVAAEEAALVKGAINKQPSLEADEPIRRPTQVRRPRFKEPTPASTNKQVSHASSSNQPPQGFRSRLSSISGALQHPRRLLFSGHQAESTDAGRLASSVQITTTSIDSPQHAKTGAGHAGGAHDDHQAMEAAAAASRAGRRLSQLFLPQISQTNLILNQMQDPYANNELFPPHLLGLYGQPPLVAGAASPGGHRASWADASLFGRLSNVRPSVDSAAFQSAQMRHSFDARK